MAKSNKKGGNVVYSTNPNYQYEEAQSHSDETPPNNQQKLYVSIDRKQRGGKEVTLIEGFSGTEDDLKELGKFLKSKCGVGGTVKSGEIMIQGSFKQKIHDLLIGEGYTQTKTKGGS